MVVGRVSERAICISVAFGRISLLVCLRLLLHWHAFYDETHEPDNIGWLGGLRMGVLLAGGKTRHVDCLIILHAGKVATYFWNANMRVNGQFIFVLIRWNLAFCKIISTTPRRIEKVQTKQTPWYYDLACSLLNDGKYKKQIKTETMT